MPGKRAKQSNRKVIKKIGNGASKNPKKAQKLRTGVKKKNMGKGGY